MTHTLAAVCNDRSAIGWAGKAPAVLPTLALMSIHDERFHANQGWPTNGHYRDESSRRWNKERTNSEECDPRDGSRLADATTGRCGADRGAGVAACLGGVGWVTSRGNFGGAGAGSATRFGAA